MKLNRKQLEALARVYMRSHSPDYDKQSWLRGFRAFRRTVQPYYGGSCAMVHWAGMWLGIEEDGYTHS
jgi:hypothetical protein